MHNIESGLQFISSGTIQLYFFCQIDTLESNVELDILLRVPSAASLILSGVLWCAYTAMSVWGCKFTWYNGWLRTLVVL